MTKREKHEMRILGNKKEKEWNTNKQLPNKEYKEEPISKAELAYLKDKAAYEDDPM